eukprot:XP_019074091.1 PREDICTED: putative membrane-bound O-acyltransferase C24H6.01c isoform X4 [Vitis vinifera]
MHCKQIGPHQPHAIPKEEEGFRFCSGTFPGFPLKNQTDPNPSYSKLFVVQKRAKAMKSYWKKRELTFLILYALLFYIVIIRRSLQISHDYYRKVLGLRPGWVADQLNDVSDAQWRNFRGNLPTLTVVFGIFAFVANLLRAYCQLKARGMAVVWLLISLIYLAYLHGACIIFVLSIASANFLLVKATLGLFGPLPGYL